MVKIKGISSASPVVPELPSPPRPDREVAADARRRAFTAEYKQRILAEADVAIAQPGAIGGMLRCEKVGFG